MIIREKYEEVFTDLVDSIASRADYLIKKPYEVYEMAHTALIKAGCRIVNDWMPISTAPENNSVVWIKGEGNDYEYLAYWGKYETREGGSWRVQAYLDKWEDVGPHEIVSSCMYFPEGFTPTEWRCI